MSTPPIAIASFQSDHHAHIVREILRERHGATCHVVPFDRLSGAGRFAWTAGNAPERFSVPDSDGGMVDASGLGLVWWRRVSLPQVLPDDLDDPAHVDLINTDSYTSWFGAFLTSFRGRWVSDPVATRSADNKLVQLPVARRAGLRIPRTLVSQDPDTIRRFAAELGGALYVKPVRPSTTTSAERGQLTREQLTSDDALRRCPVIYQEQISGQRHLRVCVFGQTALGAVVDTAEPEWRHRLEAECAYGPIEEELRQRLRRTLDELQLAMGIFDLKLTEEGEPVWMDLEPQGPFLAEAAGSTSPLAIAFADYLASEAREQAGPEP